MSRTVAGFVLVAGLLIALLFIAITQSIQSPFDRPELDFRYDLYRYASGSVAVVGIAMFFFGVLRFSQKTS